MVGSQIYDANDLKANLFYRGHVRHNRIELRRGEGVTVEYQPPRHAPATISVAGDLREPGAVVFIFDCSRSMNLEFSPGKSRMEVAQEVFRDILRGLAKRPRQFQVGVMYYGRRLAWEFVGDHNERRVNSTMSDPGEKIGPDEDTELVLPLRPFGEAELALVEQQLKRTTPWGGTPLYLAISEALKLPELQQAAGTRRIIVITDGYNRVNAKRAQKICTASELIAEVQGQQIEIDIVGVDLNGKQMLSATWRN